MTPDAPDTDAAEIVRLRRELDAAHDDIARLRQEIWELRDGMIGAAAQERSLDFLIRENDRLRYLVRRPWRAAGMGIKQYSEKASMRIISKRSGMGSE